MTERVVPEMKDEHEIMEPDRMLLDRYEQLKTYLSGLGSCAVGFSGGVDSTFLLYAAHEAGIPVIAVTAAGAFLPGRELAWAESFCAGIGVPHYIEHFEADELPGFSENPKNRCYICKKGLFSRLTDLAHEKGMKAVCEASNLDDNGDYRPGLQAVAELGIRSPLRTVGFTKAQIRSLSKKLGLPTFNKPSSACLASRIPYGEPITEEKLGMAEQAEQLLMELGFHQFRVRMHGKLARIELLPAEFSCFMEEKVRKTVYERLKELGFTYVTLDICGYRTGSMNETLSAEELAEGKHL